MAPLVVVFLAVSWFGNGLYSTTGADVSTAITACYDGWLAFKGSCYYFGHERMPFTSALNYCKQRHDSHLIHVEDSTENEFIKDQLRTNFKERNWWLGLTDEDIEGTWKWVDTDTDATFLDWLPGQPNVHADDCSRFAIETNDNSKFQWADNSCSLPYYPICELSGDGAAEIIG